MEMDLGLIYGIIAFICAALISVILDRTVATRYKETIDHNFCLILAFFIAFTLVDGVWGLFYSRLLLVNQTGLNIFTYAFHCMAALSAFVWFGYGIFYLGAGRRATVVLNALRIFLLLVQIILIVANIWTKYAFTVNHNAEYVYSALRSVMFAVQFAYYVVLMLYAVFKLLRKRGEAHTNITAILFSLVPLFFGVAQMLFADAPMYSVGFMFTAVLIYSFNVTEQRERYMQEQFAQKDRQQSSIIQALAKDYRYLYYVDLDTNSYSVFAMEDDDTSIVKKTPIANDFFNAVLMQVHDSVFSEDRTAVIDRLSKANLLEELSQKKEIVFNYRLTISGEPRYYQAQCVRSNIPGDENKLILGVSDIDEELHEELERQNELELAMKRAEAANTAKSSFLFNMSHDIRTPMNAILGFANMAEKHIDDRDRVLDSISKVKSAGEHLLSILNDVLDMSRIESGKVVIDESPVFLKKAGEALISMVSQLAAERNIELIVNDGVSPDVCVYADEMRMSRVFMNVLSNAIKYTPMGGSVFLTIREYPDERAGYLKYVSTIRDTGIGMSEEFLEHIFEAFSREQSTTVSGIQGSGLGMAITKELVSLMNGRIEIQSKLGVGTTVTLTFSFSIADDHLDDELELQRNNASLELLSGKKVLLVEDNDLNREIARDILEELGMIVDEANDGTVAVEKCAVMVQSAKREMYADYILMDVQMPLMDGYTATAKIRALDDPLNTHIPIIAMTANAFAEDKQRAMNAGMDAHLSKPVKVNELIETLCAFPSIEAQ